MTSASPAIAERRRKEATSTIAHKLDVLERWLVEGIPAGVSVPTSLNQFRVWEDEALGVRKIGSKSTLYESWNASLRKRAERVIRSLANDLKRSASKRDSRAARVARLQRELEDLKRQLADMVTRYRAEREAVRRLTRELVLLRQRPRGQAEVVASSREVADIGRWNPDRR